MSGHDPFAGSDDGDRTVIRPSQAGSRRMGATPLPDSPASPMAEDAVAGRDDHDLPSVGATPLAVAAAPLLQLVARLRNTLSQPDASALRARTVRELHAFEQAARAAGIAMDQLRPAHYALCATLDDVVLNTPWGSRGVWAEDTLVAAFHVDVRGDQHFFELLRRGDATPGTPLPVLELMYLCLALGYQGRYRQAPHGTVELDAVRTRTHALIRRLRPAPDMALSPHWTGVTAPYRPRRARLPLWVGCVVAVAVVAGAFAWFSLGLNRDSDALSARMLASAPAAMPPILRAAEPEPPAPGPTEPGVLDRLRAALGPDIDSGAVAIVGTETTPVVRIADRGMFAAGAAIVQPGFAPLLARVGAALKAESGAIDVVAYTDSQPVRTVAFPSSFHLTAARARAAAALLAPSLDDPGRVRTEGRAGADPIAPNTTADGRERNRRIEVVLHRPA